MIYLVLLYEFFKIALFTIGGGLASIPYLILLSNKYNWYSIEQLIDMIAISESTPGPIAINISTYAGYNTVGVLGGITASIGFALPSIILVYLVIKVLDRNNDNKYIRGLFNSIRPIICAFILKAAIDISIISINNNFILAIIIIFIFILLIRKYKLHPIFYILGGGVLGIIMGYFGII